MVTTTSESINGLPSAVRAVLAFGRGRWLWAALILLALLPIIGGATGLIGNYGFLQLSLMVVFSIAVLGLNLLTGFNGQISLGHGAFFAIGAYTTAILMFHLHLPYWLTLPFAAIACFVAGYLFGLPALRLEGHYLALATFGLAIAVPQMLKYRHIEGLTGGVQGLQLDRAAAPFGLPLTNYQWMYLVALAVAVLMFWIARNLLHSRTGRAQMAIRDHPMAAGTMGINTAHYKTVTFGISALYTGVAGALFSIILEFASPDNFQFALSIAILVGAVVGGIASLPGAVVGGVFIQVIEKYADSAARQLSAVFHLPIEVEPWTIYGIALILLVYFMPMGIAGGIAMAWARAKRRWPALSGVK
jgi:branched-chain amino acid transport system permease protein